MIIVILYDIFICVMVYMIINMIICIFIIITL